jgi:predicted lipoprotein with Yx(FWY)xxD motif
MQVSGKTMTVLKNSKGLTLYYFTPDTSTKIACTGSCASAWPPLSAPGNVASTMPGLPGMFSVVDGANGKQVAYNGHPLYTYAKDQDSGDAYGQGIGGKWFVATPDLSSATSSSSASQYPAYGG